MSDPQVELSNVSVEIVRELYNTLLQSKEFVLAQAPDVCREVISRALWGNLGAGIFQAVLLVVSIWALIWSIQRMKKNMSGDYSTRSENEFMAICCGVGAAVCLFASIGLSIASTSNLYNAYYVWLGPKAYLLDYFAAKL